MSRRLNALVRRRHRRYGLLVEAAVQGQARRRGLARLTEFREAGITAVTVSRMEQAGEVVRLARGLYQLRDASLDPQQCLAEAARLVPREVICLASALAFHGLTDQMPPKVWIAMGRKDWRLG